MKVEWDRKALDDFREFQAKQPKLAARIVALIADIKQHPFTGIGKPEPLRFDYSGYWSRRVDQQHRLVYQVQGDTLTILRCRWHYK